MARKKILTTVYLTPKQLRELHSLRDTTRVPMAELIREALDRYLESRRDEIAPDGVDL